MGIPKVSTRTLDTIGGGIFALAVYLFFATWPPKGPPHWWILVVPFAFALITIPLRKKEK